MIMHQSIFINTVGIRLRIGVVWMDFQNCINIAALRTYSRDYANITIEDEREVYIGSDDAHLTKQKTNLFGLEIDLTDVLESSPQATYIKKKIFTCGNLMTIIIINKWLFIKKRQQVLESASALCTG